MKAKTILRILNILGILFRPCAWVMWKVEELVTDSPLFLFLGIILGLMILAFVDEKGLGTWLLAFSIYFCLSGFWSLARSGVLDRIEYLKNPKAYRENNRLL